MAKRRLSNQQRSRSRGRSVHVSSQGSITVLQLSQVKEIRYRQGMNLRDALLKLDYTEDQLESSGLEVRLNNRKTKDFDKRLSAGDEIILAGDVAGAR